MGGSSIENNAQARVVPWGNLLIMLLMVTIFTVQFACDPGQRYLGTLVLGTGTPASFLGYMWLHVGPAHIFFNLLVLWTFGRRVCLKTGSAAFIAAYILLGVTAATVHMLYDGRPAIGASGAIMGILGMHTVLCFKRFSPAGPWIILTWFILTVVLGVTGSCETAYLAHAGGFLGGIVLANVLLVFNAADSGETSLPPVLFFRHISPPGDVETSMG